MSESETDASPIVRPILFSAPMIQALLEGRKTQTRRLIKHHCYFGNPIEQPHILDFEKSRHGLGQWVGAWDLNNQRGNAPCPYGQLGDLLWVRETWGEDLNEDIYYCADDFTNTRVEKWRPSIHMPRWVSRLTLELTEVRVQQVKDISEADAIAQGLLWSEEEQAYFPGRNVDPRMAFNNFFAITTNFGRGIHNIAETWVWALSFRVHQQNVEQFLKQRAAHEIAKASLLERQ